MLRSIPLFKDLSDSDLALLGELAIEKPVPKGTVMFSEGEEGDSLYLIASGRVKVFIGDEDGREIILKILGPGDFFARVTTPLYRPLDSTKLDRNKFSRRLSRRGQRDYVDNDHRRIELG